MAGSCSGGAGFGGFAPKNDHKFSISQEVWLEEL